MKGGIVAMKEMFEEGFGERFEERFAEERLVEERLVEERFVEERLVEESFVEESFAEERFAEERFVEERFEGTKETREQSKAKTKSRLPTNRVDSLGQRLKNLSSHQEMKDSKTN